MDHVLRGKGTPFLSEFHIYLYSFAGEREIIELHLIGDNLTFLNAAEGGKLRTTSTSPELRVLPPGIKNGM